MARHVIVSTGATATYSAGLLANGAIDVQKMSASGPTKLVPGETLTDAAQIRIVQGTTGANIVTPWFYGKDVINYGGRVYAAATAKDETYTVSALTATAAGEATIKVSNQTNGEAPFKFKSWTTSYVIGATATTIADALKALIALDQADFVNCDNTGDSDATLDFSGFITGATDNAGVVNEGEPTMFDVSFEDVNATDAARTVAITIVGAHLAGIGMAYTVRDAEYNSQGINFGYYNRIQQPVAPTTYTDVTTPTTYDMYHIACTKDGSSASQIHGVDNVIDITLAVKAAQAGGVILENQLNPYMLDAGFASISL
tara:strand:+ start:2169 stop:3113 length:945 start_codon:yes stop_codon:yes gene_type:complete